MYNSQQKTSCKHTPYKQQGFSLIELMIVVAIIGILTMVAYPSYQNSIMKSRRGDATAAMMGFANAMERHFTNTGSYQEAAVGDADSGTPQVFAATTPLDSSQIFYNLTLTATQTTYTLTATPAGTQANDTSCMNLTLDNTGVRGISGSGTPDDCW